MKELIQRLLSKLFPVPPTQIERLRKVVHQDKRRELDAAIRQLQLLRQE